jgi:DNA-binding transcriptional LysR family regulator
MRRFDLRQLEYFVAVAEEQSFRRAAERLHLTQPPLSRQIRALEDALRATLFDRSKQGVVLTPAGTALLPLAKSVLVQADSRADRIAADAQVSALHVAISVAVLPEAVVRLERAWRNICEIRMTSGCYSSELLDRVRDGSYEMVVAGLPGETQSLQTIALATEPVVVAIPSSHKAARKRMVSLHDFSDLPLFWWSRHHNPAYYDHC